MSYPDNFNWLSTFEDAARAKVSLTRKEFNRQSRDNRKCCNCENHVWRLAQTGMCFSCTTGETDASDDYEVGSQYSF